MSDSSKQVHINPIEHEDPDLVRLARAIIELALTDAEDAEATETGPAEGRSAKDKPIRRSA